MRYMPLQDYHWWWRSFLTSGFTAFYLAVYCIHYFITKVAILECYWKLISFSLSVGHSGERLHIPLLWLHICHGLLLFPPHRWETYQAFTLSGDIFSILWGLHFFLEFRDVRIYSLTFLITNSFGRPAEHMCFCFYHLSLLSKQLTHYQLNLAFMLADTSFLQAQSDFSPASGLFAKSTVWSKWIRRSTEWLKWTRKTLHEEEFLCLTNVYLFPLPAISFFLNSQDFSRFSSPISPGSMDPGTWPWSWDQDVPWSPDPGALYPDPVIWDPIKHFLRNNYPAPLSCPVIVR